MTPPQSPNPTPGILAEILHTEGGNLDISPFIRRSRLFARAREHFKDQEDPRRDHGKMHPLPDILVLSVMAMIGRCEEWVEIADFGAREKDWFQANGLFPHGMPSHDTLGRVFRLLDAAKLRESFSRWMRLLVTELRGKVIAIDGKTSRGTGDGPGKLPIHTVSAVCTASGMTLAHVPVVSKSNEITAIPVVLDLLALKGCIVTIDAMGCQKDIVNRIRDGQADYLLQVKANQSTTLNAITDFFADSDQRAWKGIPHDVATTVDNRHGRKEFRQAWACPVQGPWIEALGWKDLVQIVRIRRSRTVAGTTTVEDHYFITSLATSAQHILKCARQHWAIENQTHWVLDVAFNEDRSRVRKDHAPHNLVTIRRFVLNLLRKNPDPQGRSLKRRRQLASYDINSILDILDLIPVSVTE